MDNLSLFDLPAEQEQQSVLPHAPGLDVVKLEFAAAKTMPWTELFAGFDSLYAITYSSGLNFVYQLLDLFAQAEVIFGCEDVMSYSLQEIMAYQCKLVEHIRETAGERKGQLLKRMDAGDIRFYVAHNVLSHEKLYLLSSKDGRKRVVMGSANLSYQAFGGQQRETICYMDGDTAYDWYWGCYTALRESSTDQIAKETLLYADDGDNLEQLPIARTIRMKKAMILQQEQTDREAVQFALEVKSLAGKLAPAVPKPDKKGKLMLSPEKIKTVRRQVVSNQAREKELQTTYPCLEVLPEEGIARLNGVVLDLNPEPDEIRKDVSLFLSYMDGYEKFHGDVAGMQNGYYAFSNWFFCSPFMAGMRDVAVRYNQNLLPYPVFGLVYGQSKAGKTSFLETLLKMMIGQKTKLAAPDFTRTSIEGLKHKVKGAPIIVDDLTNTRFNQHAIETIKNDDFGVADNLLHYPAVVISANEDVKAVMPEVIRRTVICRVQAGLTNTEVMRSSVVRTVQREIGTAFYRAYLSRMLEIAAALQADMRDEETESAPDILAASSEVLLELFSTYSSASVPSYMRPLSLEDYFSERVTGSYAMKTVRNAWKTSRASFEVLGRANELRYNAGATWEADRILKELPETLEAHKSREWVVMNLEEARTFFEMSFQKSWMDRFRK